MTFEEIQNELVNFRFGEKRRASAKLWINRREQAIWGYAEWPFKRVLRYQLNFNSSQQAPNDNFRKAISFELADGTFLQFLEPAEFFKIHTLDESPGTPSDFTVWDGLLHFGPAPTNTMTGYLTYLRGIGHINGSGVATNGVMVLDDDTPMWDSEFHFLLVLGAMATGLKLENDSTWDSLEQEFQQGLMEMAEDLLPPDVYGTRQYGADNLT